MPCKSTPGPGGERVNREMSGYSVRALTYTQTPSFCIFIYTIRVGFVCLMIAFTPNRAWISPLAHQVLSPRAPARASSPLSHSQVPSGVHQLRPTGVHSPALLTSVWGGDPRPKARQRTSGLHAPLPASSVCVPVSPSTRSLGRSTGKERERLREGVRKRESERESVM